MIEKKYIKLFLCFFADWTVCSKIINDTRMHIHTRAQTQQKAGRDCVPHRSGGLELVWLTAALEPFVYENIFLFFAFFLFCLSSLQFDL